MSVTEAARHFSDVVNRCVYRGESTLLLRSGEPVARISPAGGVGVTGSEFAQLWLEMGHLDAEDAADFFNTVNQSRAQHPMPDSKWD